jgi:hypothetical protein
MHKTSVQDKVLLHEQQYRWREVTGENDSPNTGFDRLLDRLREVHGHPRYDIPMELTLSMNVCNLLRSKL